MVNLKNDSDDKAKNQRKVARQRYHRTQENLKLALQAVTCMPGCDGWTKEALRHAWVHGQVDEYMKHGLYLHACLIVT